MFNPTNKLMRHNENTNNLILQKYTHFDHINQSHEKSIGTYHNPSILRYKWVVIISL